MKLSPLILNKLKELVDIAPDLSFGEILYSILREPILKQVVTDTSSHTNINWVLNISDKDIYTAIEKAKEIEVEYKQGKNE